MLDVTVGEAVLVTVAFVDGANQAMPATGVSISVRKPDGTVMVGTVTPGSGTGKFEALFVADQAGTWMTKATCEGPLVAKDEDIFTASRLRFDSTGVP